MRRAGELPGCPRRDRSLCESRIRMNEQETTAEALRVRIDAGSSRLLQSSLVACAAAPPAARLSAKPMAPRNVYPSTYKRAELDPATLIRGATILTGAGTRIDNGDVLIANGRIDAVGTNLTAPAGARVIDAQDRWVTPGLIDVHSHLGVYPTPLRQCARRRQRDDRSDHAERLGGTRGLAAGPRPSDRARRRRHDAADPAGLGQSHRRPRRHAEERARRRRCRR